MFQAFLLILHHAVHPAEEDGRELRLKFGLVLNPLDFAVSNRLMLKLSLDDYPVRGFFDKLLANLGELYIHPIQIF
jgi:hypothetical protein